MLRYVDSDEESTKAGGSSDSDEESIKLNATKGTDFVVKEPHILFINESGASLHFIIDLPNLKRQEEYKKFIEERAGCVSSSLESFGPHSAVLVKDSALSWPHKGVVFKLSYIEACCKQLQILNITDFVVPKSSTFKEGFDYMDIFYFRKYTWDSVPHTDKCEPVGSKQRNCITIDSSSSTDVDSDFESKLNKISAAPTSKPFGANKNTRAGYGMKEKEAILRYIADNNLYSHMRGTAIWKEMEIANVCPIRSWQSMKEHTLKTLSKQVDRFQFLSPKEKSDFRAAFRNTGF